MKYKIKCCNWETEIDFKSSDYTKEEKIIEVATRGIEKAFNEKKDIAIVLSVEDPKNNFYVLNTYKLLINAGLHSIANKVRKIAIEEFNTDLLEEKLISKTT